MGALAPSTSMSNELLNADNQKLRNLEGLVKIFVTGKWGFLSSKYNVMHNLEY